MLKFENPWLVKGDRLVCFGDSNTAAPNGYVKVLQERLACHGVEAINAGRGGDKTPWALTRLERDVIERRPAAVSLLLGSNDAAIGRGRWADEPRVSPDAYRCNLVWIMHLCKLAGIRKFSVTPPLWRFEGEQWAEFGDVLMPYCQAARDAATEMGARLAPADIAIAEEWARHPGHTGLLLTTDGVHLTERGSRIVAETMLATWGFPA
jgi:lysophospholipase L1-like esterase